MAKYSNIGKLTSQEEQDLLLEFCYALVTIRKPEEAALFLRDLLSQSEIEMLAKRLKIARLLIQGKTFVEVVQGLKTSMATIARVNEWLKESGEGYRLVLERTKDKPFSKVLNATNSHQGYSSAWSQLKRKYPTYYWPELLLKEIIKSASVRERKRLLNTLKILKTGGKKTKLFLELEKILTNSAHGYIKY